MKTKTTRRAPPDDPAQREAWKALQELGSVGPATAKDFILLGFTKPEELRGQDAQKLYERLCKLTNSKQDPCVLDVLRCAIAQAENPRLPEKWKNWWAWTPYRDLAKGSLPPPLRR